MIKNFYLIDEVTRGKHITLCIMTTEDRENAPNKLKEVLIDRYKTNCEVLVKKSCVAYINCVVTFEGGRKQKYQMNNFVGYEK